MFIATATATASEITHIPEQFLMVTIKKVPMGISASAANQVRTLVRAQVKVKVRVQDNKIRMNMKLFLH